MPILTRERRDPAAAILEIRNRKAVERPDAAENRRWAQRRGSFAQGRLIADELGEPLSCIVLDTSSTGARVKPQLARSTRCRDVKDLPKALTLFFVIDRVAIDCTVAWRREGLIGLRFVSPTRPVPKPARMMKPQKPKK